MKRNRGKNHSSINMKNGATFTYPASFQCALRARLGYGIQAKNLLEIAGIGNISNAEYMDAEDEIQVICDSIMVLHRAHAMDEVENNFMCAPTRKRVREIDEHITSLKPSLPRLFRMIPEG